MKKKIIVSAIALLVIGLFVPIPKTYADGTKSYNAIAYKIVSWNRPFYKNLMYTERDVYKFPHSLRSVDYLWEHMAIDPAVSEVRGVVVDAAGNGASVEVLEGDGDILPGEIIEVPADENLEKSDIVQVEYVPEVKETGKKIKQIVDVRKESSEEKTVEESENAEKHKEKTESTTSDKVIETTMKSTQPVPRPVNSDESIHYIRLSWNSSADYPQVVFIRNRGQYKSTFGSLTYSSSADAGSEDVYDNKYTDEFFKDRALIVIFTSESSGSDYYTGVKINSDKNEIYINRYVPEVRTCDMASWAIVCEVSADDPILTKDNTRTQVIKTE